jgi:hypothetical protein
MVARKSPSLVYPNPSKVTINDSHLSGLETRDTGQEADCGMRQVLRAGDRWIQSAASRFGDAGDTRKAENTIVLHDV